MDVSFVQCLEVNLSTVPVKTGQLIHVTDRSDYYLDSGTPPVRKKVTDIVPVVDQTELNSIVNPLVGKFYFVKATREMKIHNGVAWTNIMADSIATRVFYENGVSNIDAHNTQDAIDLLVEMIKSVSQTSGFYIYEEESKNEALALAYSDIHRDALVVITK